MNIKIELRTDTKRKDGLHQLRIKVGTGADRRFIPLDIHGSKDGWNAKLEQFYVKGSTEQKEQYKKDNAVLRRVKTKCENILADFERAEQTPTSTLFIQKYKENRGRAKVVDYFNSYIKDLRDTERFGTTRQYEQALSILRLFEKRFDKLYFADIDFRFVEKFDMFLRKRSCNGNTRRYYHRTLRAIFNRAVRDKATPENSKPYGQHGFKIDSLEEETAKRYLPTEIKEKVRATEISDNPKLEEARRIFMALYLCYGISYKDACLLTKKNIIQLNDGAYIEYRREKTKHAKRAKPICFPITSELQQHFDWFAENCDLVGDYLFPIITVKGLKGEALHKHIRQRYETINRHLKKVAIYFGIENMSLTSYVARHTFAMAMQENNVATEHTSEMLGHSELSTTKTYLDSFKAERLAKITRNIL
jgi:hypothetical protein